MLENFFYLGIWKTVIPKMFQISLYKSNDVQIKVLFCYIQIWSVEEYLNWSKSWSFIQQDELWGQNMQKY